MAPIESMSEKDLLLENAWNINLFLEEWCFSDNKKMIGEGAGEF